MRKLFFILVFLLPLAVRAQEQQLDTAKAADKPIAATSAPASKKEKPIILDKQKLLELDNLALRLQNAQLRAEAAIPAELKAEVKTANEAVDKFWAAVGIKREELAKYNAANGVDGAIILTKAEAPAPAPATKAEPAKPK